MNNTTISTLSDDILSQIRIRPGHFYTMKYLAGKFKCEKSDIIVAIDLLRQSGYDIKADPSSRYAFFKAPDALLAAEIKYKLKTSFIGKHVYSYKSVQSTNTIASQLAQVGAPEGTVVVAESQTKGRGRLGRSWFSPIGTGIYLSIIVYPKIEPARAPGLSVMTALSLADTIASYDELDIKVKWPNDCLIDGRKVAGILTELTAEVGQIHYVVIGVGININQTRRDFPPDIIKTATSMRIVTKEVINRVQFLQAFLRNFERDYKKFKKSGLAPLRKRIVTASNLIGKNIKLDMKGRIVTGVAVDINENGNLMVDTSEGVLPFNAGEVTILKK